MAKKFTFQVKYPPLLIVLVLLFGLLAACSDEGAAPTPTLPASVTAAGTVETVGKVTATAGAAPGATVPAGAALPYDCAKIFCFGLAQEPVAFLQGRFDPANLIDRPSLQITRQVYETLFEFKPSDMQYRNSALVKSVGISEDGLHYTIRIGKGLRFSDDTLLNVEAVKFNFDRWADPGNLYHKGEFQTWAYYFGGFPGNLASVEADPANSTVTLNLKSPMGSLPQVLALPQFAMVAPSAFNGETGEMERSVGSSFYAIDKDKIVRGETKYVVLRENRQFFTERYAEDDPNAPYVKSKQIVAVVLKQNQEGLDELRKGTVAATDKIKPEQVPDAARDPAFKLLERKPLSVAFLGLNHTAAPMNNLSVRQAFALAIDTRTLVRDYYQTLGQPASVLLPPTVLGYSDLHEPYPYDPDRARQLLDNAGYNLSNPLRLNLWVLPVPRPYYPDPKKIAEAIAADLAKVGVTVTVQDSYAWPEFRKQRLANKLDLYLFGWEGHNGDPDEFLSEFFGKQQGEGGYENLILQTLIGLGLAQADLKDRRDFYKQAQDVIYEQLPVIPLAYVRGVVAVRPNLSGYAPNPTGIESWATVELGGK